MLGDRVGIDATPPLTTTHTAGGTVQVSVLGPVHIRRDGDEMSLGPRLQRLLAALVIERGHVVSADALAEMVWDGDPPAGAHTTLRSYVTRLRQALDADASAIEFRQPGYVLDAAGCAVDADAFETDVEDARLALQLADLGSAETAIERALGRWQGTPFGEIDDETWVRPERVRLEERRTEARELHVEVMLADGRSEQAIASARRLTEEHPLRERPRELLMRAMYIVGRRAEAVRAYREYRELLADQTGLDPSDELAALEGQILAGEVPRQPPAGRARGYELGDVLGRGAFSVVHRATQPGVGRDVAVKIIRAELADRPEFVRHFEHEAQLAAAVEHPFVVPLYDFWREPGAAFLVMRWMRGGDLSRALRERGPLSRDQLCRVLDDIGGALHAAHRAGVLHRDVRPANLLRDDDGATYLADFGIAVGSAIGLSARPVHYAAPEVLRGEAIDSAADVHSLGVSTFELLTGRLPLSDTTDRAELVRRQLSEALPSVQATRSDLPPQIDDVLARATSKVASERYATVPEFVDDVVSVLAPAGRAPMSRASGAPAPNPYLGLHAFAEADADRFHGRDQLIGELADALEQHPLVAVVGPSGSGKSSVVRAGLVPAIRTGAVPGSEAWFVTTMVPGHDPIGALETALLRIAVNPPASLRDQLAEDGGLLRAVRRVLPDDDSTVLVVIDQFEELFTVVDSDDLRRRFLRELAHAISAPGSPLRVVATLRADHYDAPLRDPALAQLVTDGTVTIRPMRADELEAAIVRPATGVGASVEPALVAELIAGVSDRPAALPLLQFSLTELYERRLADVMLLETHQSLGGLAGALAARAERIIERGDDCDRDLIRRMFTRLIAFGESAHGDARRRATLAELGYDERTAWLIDEFVAARLLVVDRDDETREPTLEVAHEALLRDWPRLANWIDEDRVDLRVRRMITAAASEWTDAGGDAGMLARGGRLELVADLADRRPELINELERGWIDRSSEAAAAEAAKERRRRRHAFVTAAVVVVLALIGTTVAVVLRNRAADNERVAEARELVLEAEKAIADDPELGLLLGLEAADAFEGATGEVPTSALQVLRAGIRHQHARARFPGGGWVVALPNHGAIATAGKDMNGDGVADGIAIGDLESGAIIDEIVIEGWTVFQGRWDGDHLLVAARPSLDPAAEDSEVALFRVDPETHDHERLRPDISHDAWMNEAIGDSAYITRPTRSDVEVVRAADGQTRTFEMVATAEVVQFDGLVTFPVGDDEAPAVAVVDVATWARTDIAIVDFLPQYASLSPDARLVASSRQSGEVAVHDRLTGAPAWDEPLRLARSGFPRWSPDGARLVIGNENNLTIIDAATGTVIQVLDLHDGGTWSYDHIGDSGLVATAGISDQATLVIDPRDGVEVDVAPASFPITPFFIGAAASGDVVGFDLKDFAVVDVERDRSLGVFEGEFVGGTDFGNTMPVLEPSGRYISVYDELSRLRNLPEGLAVWDAPPGWTIRGADANGSQVIISRDDPDTGTTTTNLVTLRDNEEGLVIVDEIELVGAGASIGTATFSPSGELVVVSPLDPDWSTSLYRSDGTLVQRFDPQHFVSIRWGFTGDERLIFGGGLSGDIVGLDLAKLQEGASGEEAEVFRIAAHKGLAAAFQLSPDERLIASQARTEPVRVWDIETGQMRAEFGTGETSTSIAFHPEQPWVYVSEGNRITVHTLDVDELIDSARASVTRDLTEEECQRYLRRSCD